MNPCIGPVPVRRGFMVAGCQLVVAGVPFRVVGVCVAVESQEQAMSWALM